MKRIILSIAAVGCFVGASAQIRVGEKGQLTGSFESNSILYVDDDKLGTNYSDRFGSNDFLKLDYILGRFSVGVQAEAYLPALQGFDDLRSNGYDDPTAMLSSKYIQWQDDSYSILVGDVYDQFGNGLVLRSFEDRQLGINNSIEGGRVTGRFGNYVSVKALFGRPRLYSPYSKSWLGSQYARSTVGGADLSLSLSDMMGMEEAMLSIEGSYVNRHETLTRDENRDFSQKGLESPNLNMYSGRICFDWKGFTLNAEYAGKGKDLASNLSDKAVRGTAVMIDAAYSIGNLSLSGQMRRLEDMGTQLSLYGSGMGNTLNYLPALTRQYTYMLANLNPYQVNTEGEIGAQGDVYYSLRNKGDRYRYWTFHANYSTYYTLNAHQSRSGDHELLWRDLNFDVERQWNKKLKTVLLYSFQEWNPYHGSEHRTYVSNVFVADATYKFTGKTSLRVEAQYLLSDEYEGDWVAGLFELSFAPHWSVFFSDMYNIDLTKKNYYNGGASYTHNRTRVQLAYGRNRAGYICSGGVCRYQPQYTGLNLMITTSF